MIFLMNNDQLMKCNRLFCSIDKQTKTDISQHIFLYVPQKVWNNIRLNKS